MTETQVLPKLTITVADRAQKYRKYCVLLVGYILFSEKTEPKNKTNQERVFLTVLLLFRVLKDKLSTILS